MSHNTGDGGQIMENNGTNGHSMAETPETNNNNNGPALLLVGTLSYSSAEGARRQHQIRGNWKFENAASTAVPQRFELLRSIPPEEELEKLPADGEYHGTFSLAWEIKTSKGKLKTKRKSVVESGVQIAFTPTDEGVFTVKGTGLNEYGKFDLVGTATKSTLEDDPGYHIRLTKMYTQTTVPVSSQEEKKEDQKQVLPPPTSLPPENVVCLRGKLARNTSENLSLGLGDVIHKISGVWAMGLNYILDDPENTKALCNKFEYEHKCSGESTVFPLSGKYTGWFYVNADDGSKTKIHERDIMLKFIENDGGFHNVEGKGSNLYGKYTISGTLDKDGIITLFRHFQPQKIKLSKKKETKTLSSTPAPGLLNAGDKKGASAPDLSLENLPLAFDDVEAPDGSELVPTVSPPAVYGAVSKGIFKITEDGNHSCSGNWALTFDQLSSGTTTSSFFFGILPNIAAEDAKTMLERMESSGASKHDDRKRKLPDRGGPAVLTDAIFPIDSARYRGSFKMKKGISKNTTVKDEQVILKFVKNASGGYNVYGRGTNSMGVYDITGTLILATDTSGHLILYRVYPPLPAEPQNISQPAGKSSGKVFPGSLTEKAVGGRPSVNPPEKFIPSNSSLQRRESSRQVKAPLRLEEDDPEAQRASLMDKCRQTLKDLMSKDAQGLFAVPVDPVALNIPTYFDVIKNPMDLGTINSRLESGELDQPDEFIRLVRLVFENATTFNTMPDSYVAHQARSLLTVFNAKIKSVERVLEGSQKNKKPTKAELNELKRKEKEAKKKGKRKGTEEGGNDSKRMKLDDYISESKTLIESFSQAASQVHGDSVSRTEFNRLMQLVQLQHDQIISLHKLVKSSSSSGGSSKNSTHDAVMFDVEESRKTTTPPKKKKPKAEKAEKKSKPPPSPELHPEPSPEGEPEPLSFEEQEQLSEDIMALPESLLPGVMQIIREGQGDIGENDEEIDIDLDSLSTITQRRLQQYISENDVKPKPKKRKRKSSVTPAPAPVAPPPDPSPEPESEEKPPSKVNPRPSGKSFFSMGQDDSDSDSEPDTSKDQVEVKTNSAPADPFADDDDMDDDEDDDLNAEAIAASWAANSSQDAKPEDEGGQDDENDDDEEEDDLWGAAKKEAEASKALEEDRAKREEKMIAEANMAMQKRMEEAQALGEEVRAKREEEAAAEARRLEQEAIEAENARIAAREKALQEVNEVKNTIDLDAQRELMKQYEQEFNDNYSAGASPSSDYGF